MAFWASPHLLPELPRAILHLKWTQTGCVRQKRALPPARACDLLFLSSDPQGGESPGIAQGYWAPASAPTAALDPARAWDRLWCDSSFRVPVPGQKNLAVDSVTSQLKLMRACPCLSVPLCYVIVDGTQNKCPIPAQLEMTVSTSSPQGVLLSLFSICRQTKVITAFPSPQGYFTKHIFMPSLVCCFGDCLDEAAFI